MLIACAAAVPACGRSEIYYSCLGRVYSIVGFDTLRASVFNGVGAEVFGVNFAAPRIQISDSSHKDAAGRARAIALVFDGAREECRRVLEAAGHDPRQEQTNCDDFAAPGYIAGHVDDLLNHVPAGDSCPSKCLLDEDCEPGDTGGGSDDPAPFASRTVRCACVIADVEACAQVGVAVPASRSFTSDICVPTHVDNPAEYCRNDVASYFRGVIRMVNSASGIPEESCASTHDLEIDLFCRPEDYSGSIDEDAALAYTKREPACIPGCASLDCIDFVATSNSECSSNVSSPGSGCMPEDECRLSEACDCDLIPSACLDTPLVEGVCLPNEVPFETDGGGADSSGGGNGGTGTRLESATTRLAGLWLASNLDCDVVDFAPGIAVPQSGSSGGIAPYVATNSTSFTSGIQLTCAHPATQVVQLSSLGTSLKKLCLALPICSESVNLGLTVKAKRNGNLLATGTLTKTGATIATNESGAVLGAGVHAIDLCVTHTASAIEGCVTQPVRLSAPLGGSADAFGHFAGEVGLDFIPLASKPGATALALGDDTVVRVLLPSGFTFPFYDEGSFGSIYVGANGGIRVSNGSIPAANVAMTSATAPSIAVYWDDLDPSAGGHVWTWFDGRRFIVSWEGVAHGRDAGTSTGAVSVQAHLYADGRIELHHLDTAVGASAFDDGRSATVGVGKTSHGDVLQVSRDSSALISAGVRAMQIGSTGCIAEQIAIPPEITCSATDLFTTACTPTGGTVVIPTPGTLACEPDAVEVQGRVVAVGASEANLHSLSVPRPIIDGSVALDAGVAVVEWTPLDAVGDPTNAPFEQRVFVATWANNTCGGQGRTMTLMTEFDDEYDGGGGSDGVFVLGLAGEDTLVAGQGSDLLVEGEGAGVLEANDGDDDLLSEGGNDTLACGPGADRAWGGTGDDLLVGELGADLLDGQEGSDILQGGDGDDELWGGAGDDLLEGGAGADTIYPGSGIDIVEAGDDDDTIVLLDPCELAAGDALAGGSGYDTILVPPGFGAPELAQAGVEVSSDIEAIVVSNALQVFRSDCA